MFMRVQICHHFQEYLTTVQSDTAVGVCLYTACVLLCLSVYVHKDVFNHFYKTYKHVLQSVFCVFV